MDDPFKKIDYKELNARQKEAFNFQKVSAVLADYGFVTIRLSNDWESADFIAQHNGGKFLKVQLKGRLTFDKKYLNRDLWICFPSETEWFLYPHDELLNQVKDKIAETDSWKTHGLYHYPRIPANLRGILEGYRLQATEARGITSFIASTD